MANSKRKNGEGSYSNVKIHGDDYCRYRDAQIGTVYARTPSELQMKIKEKRAKIKELAIVNGLKSTNLTTFSNLCDMWLPTIYGEISARTYDDYESIIKTRIKEYKTFDLANRQAKALIPETLNKYFNDMANRYSMASIRKTYIVIQQVIKYAIKHDYVRSDFDFSEVKLPKENTVAVKKKKVSAITTEDIKLLTQELEKPIYGPASDMIVFIMFSGLRVNEATALQWKNVATDLSSIKIEAATSRIIVRGKDHEALTNDDGTKKYTKISKSPKSEDGNRTIPLPPKAQSILRKFKDERNPSDNDFVFLTKNGTPVSSDNARKTLSRALKNSECRVKTYSPHSLRHGYGSILISEGVDIKLVSKLLGHSKVSFTYDTYINILKEDEIREVNRVFSSIK